MMALGIEMPRTRRAFNPKRRIERNADAAQLSALAVVVSYGGNPEHKSTPGDFALTPPAQPRADKTLCEGANIVTRSEAERLLKEGVRKGLVSVQTRGQFPQNIWAVTDNGCPLEAQLKNQQRGIYHGYPVPHTDPFGEVILEYWNKS